MKILHVVQNYSPSVGGTQWLFQCVSERLVSDFGDEVTVFTTDSYYGPHKKVAKKIPLNKETINGVQVKRFSFYNFYYQWIDVITRLCTKLKLSVNEGIARYRVGPWSPTLKKELQHAKFDVVCGSSSHYLYMTYPLWRNNKGIPKPFIFMGALHLKEERKDDFIPKKILQAINASEFYIANTVFEKDRLVEYGVDVDKIKVVGCGIDIEKFELRTENNFKKELGAGDKIVIGFFGRQEKTKGIPMLLEAFEKLAQQYDNIVLLIAGGATLYTEEIKTKVASFNEDIRKRCTIVTGVDEGKKVEIYNTIDIFVSTSDAESFGIVFLEAWACKKPVVGARTGAVSSVIDDGVDGLLVSPGVTENLVTQLQSLIADRNMRIRMGEAGFNKVKEKYTWSIIVSKYRNIYQEAINKFYV